MAERNPRPANSTKVPWPAATYGTADPASQRAAGWAPNEIPDAEEFNFLQKMWGEEFTWNFGYLAREWGFLHEAIAAASVMDLFRVIPGTTTKVRGAELFKITGTGSGSTTVSQPCTDGERVYYLGGALRLVGASPEDGLEIFDSADVGVGLKSVCTDGAYVYVMTVDNGYLGLYRMSRNTGDEDASTGSATEYGCDVIVANGSHCVGIDPITSTGYVVIYSSIQGTIAEDGTYNTGSANLRAVDIDADQCYVGGTRNTNDIWCLANTDTSTALWTTTLPTSSAPEVYGIAADGDRVYVATDRQALTAGGNANLYCLDRINGAVLWSMDVSNVGASALDLVDIDVDHRYIYVTDSADDLHVISKIGTPAHVVDVADFGWPRCDGVSVVGNSNLSTELRRLWFAEGQTTFQRANTADVERRPFYNRAIPTQTRG
jgi:hypothetical protein